MDERVKIFSGNSLFNLEEEIAYFLETTEGKLVSLQMLIEPSTLPAKYIMVVLIYEASNARADSPSPLEVDDRWNH